MIAFRDRTFCIATCANHTCDRKLTDEVRAAADEWWGGPGSPISVANFKESCEEFEPYVDVDLDEAEGGAR